MTIKVPECNYILYAIPQIIHLLLQKMKELKEDEMHENTSGPPTFNDWGKNKEPSLGNINKSREEDDKEEEETEEEEEKTEEYDNDFTFKSEFLAMITELSRSERKTFGHNLTSMLMSCTFAGKKCTPK